MDGPGGHFSYASVATSALVRADRVVPGRTGLFNRANPIEHDLVGWQRDTTNSQVVTPVLGDRHDFRR